MNIRQKKKLFKKKTGKKPVEVDALRDTQISQSYRETMGRHDST